MVRIRRPHICSRGSGGGGSGRRRRREVLRARGAEGGGGRYRRGRFGRRRRWFCSFCRHRVCRRERSRLKPELFFFFLFSFLASSSSSSSSSSVAFPLFLPPGRQGERRGGPDGSGLWSRLSLSCCSSPVSFSSRFCCRSGRGGRGGRGGLGNLGRPAQVDQRVRRRGRPQ